MKKDQLKALAADTLSIIENCGYVANISSVGEDPHLVWHDVHSTSADTQVYLESVPAFRTVFKITNQTTLEAALELVSTVGRGVGVLNFASAKNPGGGFLRGTQAQEESLARSSTLYASLSSPQCKDFYEYHKQSGDLLYSDRMIYTRNCVVFRDDAGNLLPRPYEIDVLTAAAPNLRAIEEKFCGEVLDKQKSLVRGAITHRIRKLLTIFAKHHCHSLVLGAWGCGVFGNDPNIVAEAFRIFLSREFENRFRRVHFAIYGSDDNLEAFRIWFQGVNYE